MSSSLSSTLTMSSFPALSSLSSSSQDRLSSESKTLAQALKTTTTSASIPTPTTTIKTMATTVTCPNANVSMQNLITTSDKTMSSDQDAAWAAAKSCLPGTDAPKHFTNLKINLVAISDSSPTISSATNSATLETNSISTASSSKTTSMNVDEPHDSLPNIMKANQLTSLVHRNIPPQEQQQHFHRSALLKTILAGGVTNGTLNSNNISNQHNNETKFEMNFSNGKLGLSSHALIASSNNNNNNNNNTQSFINNNNTSLLDNNNSTANSISINNNAPLDLSIDAAIKEVVSKDEKDSGTSLVGNKLLPPHHHHHHPIGVNSPGSGRINTNTPMTPLRFPSSSPNNFLHNATSKDSFGDKTNTASAKREETPQPSTTLAAGLKPSDHHSLTGNLATPQPGTPVQSSNAYHSKPMVTSPPPLPQLPAMPASANILPRSSISSQQLIQQQQQLRLVSDVAKSSSSSSLSSSPPSIASFHKDVQHKTTSGSSTSSSDQAAAAAQKRQRGSNSTKLPENGRVRRKRQTLQEMARPLKEWMETHLDNPYPSKQDKQSLSQASNMTLVQVANWFANARRRLKIAEKRTGGDLAAKLAAISQSDHQMDIDEEMDDADGTLSEGEGELQIDLGTAKSSSQEQQQPSDCLDSRYVPTTTDQLPPHSQAEQQLVVVHRDVHMHAVEEKLGFGHQQRVNNNNNSILQRYLNELPNTEAETVAAAAAAAAPLLASSRSDHLHRQQIENNVPRVQAAEKTQQRLLQEVPLVFPTSIESMVPSRDSSMTDSVPPQSIANRQALTAQSGNNNTAPLPTATPSALQPNASPSSIANILQQNQHRKNYVLESSSSMPLMTSSTTTGSTPSQYHQRRSPGPTHRRSPGMGSVSSHDYEDCGQASSETSSTSEASEWTFNGTNGENAIQSPPHPHKMRNDIFEGNLSLHDIEIDAALALVALSRMRQTERLQRQQTSLTAAETPVNSAARKTITAEDSGVTTLSFPNNVDSTHGATIRVRQKH